MRRVAARYQGTDQIYLGQVVRIHADGRHDIVYDDGEEESAHPDWITQVEPLAFVGETSVGCQVLAQFDEHASAYYRGAITRQKSTTCDVRFDDGDVRINVPLQQVFVPHIDERDAPRALATMEMHPDANNNSENDKETAIEVTRCRADRTDVLKAVEEDDDTYRAPFGDNNIAQGIKVDCRAKRAPDGWGALRNEDYSDASAEEGFRETLPKPGSARHTLLTTLIWDPVRRAAAPPGARLALVLTESHELENLRRRHELQGETWRSGGIEARLSWGKAAMGAAADSRVLPLLDSLVLLRMRSVALSRLCHGMAAPETLQSLLDLAQSYAAVGLWPQAAVHAVRVDALLGADPDAHNELSMGVAETQAWRVSVAVVALFARLGRVADTHGGFVPWGDLVRALRESGDRQLAEQPWGVREGGIGTVRRPNMPGSGELSWTGAVSFLRNMHGGFVAAMRLIDTAAFAHDIAALDVCFRMAIHKPNASLASATALLIAVLHSRSAAATLADSGFARWLSARAVDDRSQCAHLTPVAWEECVAALVAGDAALAAAEQGFGTSKPPLQPADFLSSSLARRRCLLRARALVLQGRAAARDGRLEAAHHTLHGALHQLDAMNLGLGVVAADSHAALADIAVSKCVSTGSRSLHCAAAAEAWFATEAGMRAWCCEASRLRADLPADINAEEAILRARVVLPRIKTIGLSLLKIYVPCYLTYNILSYLHLRSWPMRVWHMIELICAWWPLL